MSLKKLILLLYRKDFLIFSPITKSFLIRFAIYTSIISVTLLYCTLSFLKSDEQSSILNKSTVEYEVKYILLWTRRDYAPFKYFDTKEKFALNNCPITNCYVTANRNYFGGEITKFHAVLFNGRNINDVNITDIPRRSPHQKFVYVNTESAMYYHGRINERIFFGFFNWTMTYRLDSDIPYPYIVVRNKTGDIIGPKINMNWESNMKDIDNNFIIFLKNKKEVAAWFSSDCHTSNKRDRYVKKLDAELRKYNYKVDIFGKCGDKKCPREYPEECNMMLHKDYLFLLAFEKSFGEDYVTGNVMRGLNFNTVPVVFGGANYSRFLPPGSYLNAMDIPPAEMAATMVHLMLNKQKYYQYFRWKNHYMYSFENPMANENVCSLCSALNNSTKFKKKSVYYNLHKWWVK